jgi:hypothetical protein
MIPTPIFCPFPDLAYSARVLDSAYILNAMKTIKIFLENKGKTVHGYHSYKAWKDSLDALADYGNLFSQELLLRSKFADTIKEQIGLNPFTVSRVPYAYPWWFGDDQYHKYHRQYLTHRNKAFYSRFWTEKPIAMAAFPKMSKVNEK